MKKTLTILSQFLLFLFVDAVGSFIYHPFSIATSLRGSSVAARSFVWDGLLLTVLVYMLVLLFEVFQKRLRSAAPASTLAFALAGLAGYLLKFGFVTHNW